jgi:hypothetical protein
VVTKSRLGHRHKGIPCGHEQIWDLIPNACLLEIAAGDTLEAVLFAIVGMREQLCDRRTCSGLSPDGAEVSLTKPIAKAGQKALNGIGSEGREGSLKVALKVTRDLCAWRRCQVARPRRSGLSVSHRENALHGARIRLSFRDPEMGAIRRPGWLQDLHAPLAKPRSRDLLGNGHTLWDPLVTLRISAGWPAFTSR